MPMHDWTRVSAGSFHTFHTAWITELARALNNGILPEPFYAESEQIAGETGPDVLALDADSERTLRDRLNALQEGGATAVVDAPPSVTITQVASEEELYSEQRNRLTIRHSSGDMLVAYVEILSSGNKSSRRAMGRFLDKVYSVLRDGVHLLVIDPYPPSTFDPQGIHGVIWQEVDPSAPYARPEEMPLTLVSYCASRPIQAFVEPICVGTTLPGMPLFLDARWYVTLPLEETYAAALEAVPTRWRRLLAE